MSNNKLDENFVNSTLPAPLSADLRSRVCFTVAEVACLLGVPVGEVRCKCRSGLLPARKFSVGYRISRAGLDDFLRGIVPDIHLSTKVFKKNEK